jgi:ABC-type nitrate/sulfonate/bicarbonate transport system substrate-binding protein
MITLRLGGVPEHFNHPVHQAIEKGLFADAGIHLQWKTYEGGTGDMTRALEENECDVCILLTEGIITAILKGNPSRIISGYVNSPLIWGVHTGVTQQVRYEEAFDKRIAISRYGSGSHLMPTVDALIKGYSLEPGQFVVIGNLDGAISSLQSGDTSVFYWEKYTTMPYVENGSLKRIGEFLSPWPCFLIASSNHFIRQHPDYLDKMLKIIHRSCEAFMHDPASPEIVSRTYGITLKHATYWFHATEWATNSWVSDKMLKSVCFTLQEAGIIRSPVAPESMIWKRA